MKRLMTTNMFATRSFFALVKPAIFFATTLLLTSHSAVGAIELSGTKAQEKATLEILRTLDKRHFVDMVVDDALSAKFLENYIDQLDPSKSFFLQSDIDGFRTKQFLLDDELKSGKNTIGFSIYQRLVERMNNRLSKTLSQLKEDNFSVDFSNDEVFIIDDERNHWPITMAESDEQWRKRIESYFLSQKLSGEDFSESLEKLINRYTDQLTRMQKNTAEDVYEIYINAFTELYDPHTNYFSPRTSESFSIRMSLSLEGIGAVLQIEDGYTQVVRVVTAGPADKQGQLKASDRILGVAQGKDGDMVSVVGWRLDEVVALIRGPKESIVRLEVESGSAATSTTKIIEIKREKVNLEDQAAQKAMITLDDDGKTFKVGIINIPTFYLDFEAYRKRDPNFRSTTKDVNRLLSELEAEGVDGVVIDLRNNGGGSLYEATAVTDLFIDKGPVVQIGKDGGKKTSDYSQNNARYRGPLVVLINRLSASASEIFAGAIQDYRRGIIVGSQSFGKGTVQTLTPLKSQGELKITESKFYRVSGESTQHRGVIPDIVMPELIDPEEVGESSYDTALAWSKTTPERHAVYFDLDDIISSLKIQHSNRIKQSADFIYLDERKELLETISNKTSISLNEDKRLAEKKRIEEQSLIIENRRLKAKGLPEFDNYEAFKDSEEKRSEERAAKAGTTQIDTVDDAVLLEAGQLLKDFTQLLLNQSQDKVASNK